MQQEQIQLTVNGETRRLSKGTSIAQLVQELAIGKMRIAVAHNGQVVPRDAHDTTHLAHGDKVEIVRMVGGG